MKPWRVLCGMQGGEEPHTVATFANKHWTLFSAGKKARKQGVRVKLRINWIFESIKNFFFQPEQWGDCKWRVDYCQGGKLLLTSSGDARAVRGNDELPSQQWGTEEPSRCHQRVSSVCSCASSQPWDVPYRQRHQARCWKQNYPRNWGVKSVNAIF